MKKIILLFGLILFMFSCCRTTNTSSITNTGGTNSKPKTKFVEMDSITTLKSDEYKLSKYDEVKSSNPSFEYHPISKSTPIYNEDKVKVGYTQKIPLKVNYIKNKIITPKDTNISIGAVIYQVPDTMIVFSKYRVTVRISKNKKAEVITEGLNNKDGDITSSEVVVSQKMEVTLKDESPDNDPSFIISQINTDQQLVDDESYTQWLFNVQPVKHGDKKLNLVISIIKNDTKKQIVYTDNITVKESIKGEVETFWGKYWQYIISTFLLPIFYFIWKRFFKKD